jgi:hypothetical protein
MQRLKASSFQVFNQRYLFCPLQLLAGTRKQSRKSLSIFIASSLLLILSIQKHTHALGAIPGLTLLHAHTFLHRPYLPPGTADHAFASLTLVYKARVSKVATDIAESHVRTLHECRRLYVQLLAYSLQMRVHKEVVGVPYPVRRCLSCCIHIPGGLSESLAILLFQTVGGAVELIRTPSELGKPFVAAVQLLRFLALAFGGCIFFSL